jgi:hypothetical protein
MRDKIYLVKRSIGSHEDYHVIDIFATQSKETADRYVEKHNRILEHWIENIKLGWERNDTLEKIVGNDTETF